MMHASPVTLASLAELEIRIYKCTDTHVMSVHYQFCMDILEFCSDIVRFCSYVTFSSLEQKLSTVVAYSHK